MLAKLNQDLNDNVHDHWSQGREAHENFVDDLSAQTFQLGIHIVEAVQSRLSKFLKLRLD